MSVSRPSVTTVTFETFVHYTAPVSEAGFFLALFLRESPATRVCPPRGVGGSHSPRGLAITSSCMPWRKLNRVLNKTPGHREARAGEGQGVWHRANRGPSSDRRRLLCPFPSRRHVAPGAELVAGVPWVLPACDAAAPRAVLSHLWDRCSLGSPAAQTRPAG